MWRWKMGSVIVAFGEKEKGLEMGLGVKKDFMFNPI